MKEEPRKELSTQNSFCINLQNAPDQPARLLARLLYLRQAIPEPTEKAYREQVKPTIALLSQIQ